MRIVSLMKPIILVTSSVFAASLLYVSTIKADDIVWNPPQNSAWSAQDYSNNYLQVIARNTTTILAKVANMPDYINNMMQYAINMIKSDSDTEYSFTTSNQANFATVGNQLVANATAQLNQTQLIADMLGVPASGFSLPADNPSSVLATVPYVNNLAYTSLLGQPPATRGDTSQAPYSYLKSAAGFTNSHTVPAGGWNGKPYDKARYSNYFNTIMSIESFSGYVLSNQLAELQNGNTLSTAQMALITQASSSDWFAHVATEEIGKVLRHILIFQSQSYVLMSELLKTQKQLVTAQVMTNTLLIQNNWPNESQLLSKAQGVAMRA